MRLLCILFFCLSSFSILTASENWTVIDGSEAKKIDDYMAVCENLGHFSGVVLAAKKGKIIFRKAYGKANYQFEIPCSVNDRFRLASVSKAFTAMAIMQLKEKGLLDTSDKAGKYLPQLKNGDKITIQDLLRMNSGFAEFTEKMDFDDVISKQHLAHAETIALVDDMPLLFKPGTKYAYANVNYIILACIVEKVSGMPFGDYLGKNILEKAGMRNTGVVSNEKVIEKLAYPYSLGYSDEIENASYIDMSIPFGTGDMYSTVDDLFLWDRILYTEKLLSRKYMDEIFARGEIPMNEQKDSYFCYAWMLKEKSDYGKIYCYEGSINGGCSWISRFVDNDSVLIILSNIDQIPIYDISEDLSALMFGKNVDMPVFRKPAKLKAEVLKKYAGKYKIDNGLEFEIILKGSEPFIKAGLKEQPVFPENESTFYFKGALNACLNFKITDGKVVAVTFTQGKVKTNGVKIE